MEINEYEQLKKQLDQVNSSIATINGKKETLKAQLLKILQNNGVKTPKELTELYLKKKEEAEKLAEEVKQYIKDASEKLSKIEELNNDNGF